MKKIIISLLLISIAGRVIAQEVINAKGSRVFIDSSKWALSGNNIYNKNSGNVGIGVSSPSAQLHTTKDVRFAGIGTNTTNTKVLTADAYGNITTRLFSNLLSGNALTSLNGLTNSVQSFAIGTSGSSFNIVSSGQVHTFNLPAASATSSGALSSADWAIFNNKISTVTASAPAAVVTTTNTATINNAGAYWNANKLQGNPIDAGTPVTGQVLSWDGAAWAPATTEQTSGAAKLASNFTTSSTSATSTNLSFPIGANEIYYVIIEGTAAKSSSTSGMKLAINAPSGCTISGEAYQGGNSLTSSPTPSLISSINTLGSTFATGNGVRVTFRMTFQVTNSSTAGNITLQAATVSSNTATIYAGTRMSWVRASAL